MHRLGFPSKLARDAYERLQACVNVKKPLGLMTHFAEADQVMADGMTASQHKLFNELTQGLAGPRSLANSAGILGWPMAHGD